MSFFHTGFQQEEKDGGYRGKFYGKYRATVTSIKDPEQLGRIKIKCPKVLGEEESNWCYPCVPFAGSGKGTVFLPKVGDTVWVEFEEGNPDKPIWVGSWFGTGEIPSTIYSSAGNVHVIQTASGIIEINDSTGVITLKGNSKVLVDGDLEVNGAFTTNSDVFMNYGALITGDNVTISTNLSVQGNISSGGNISASGRVSGSNI